MNYLHFCICCHSHNVIPRSINLYLQQLVYALRMLHSNRWGGGGGAVVKAPAHQNMGFELGLSLF